MRVRPETANAVIRISHKFGYHATLNDVRVLEDRILDLEEKLARAEESLAWEGIWYDEEARS